MNRSDKLRRMIRTAAVLATVGLLTFAGCTKVDDTLGSNLVPENQQMKAGYASLPKIDGLNPKRYIETRLYRTDSIRSSNISNGYFGAMLNDTFGLRKAGFLSQYTSYYKVDSGYFGYQPFMDSVQLLLSIKSYGSDTTTIQKFNVYEVTSNKYLTDKPISAGKSERDTIFYLNFDPRTANPDQQSIIGSDPLFSFELGGDKGPATKAITMSVNPAGREYVRRLMLLEGTYKGDYSIYSADSLEYWVKEFKGLYIEPASSPSGTSSGTIYSTSLEASGLSVYGRNRVKEDPALIKDTIGMVFYFYDSYAQYGKVSVNSISHDYSMGTNPIPDASNVGDGENKQPLTSTVYVAGMGGLVTQLTFTQEFFDALDAILAEEKVDNKPKFQTLAFSQAKMSIYFQGSDYDWRKIDPTNPGKLIDWMNASQTRLGLYTNYKTLAPVSDYAYVYESSYGTELAYGGYINRSRGSYVMDITGYMQGVWNSYAKERDAAAIEKRAIDLSKVEHRTVYLGPEAYGLYSINYSVAQGMADQENSVGSNNAPIRFDLTYNMIR